MQTISSAMQNMIANNDQDNPAARLVCDIDPPFVGVDTLMESASDPYFCEYNNVLYMSVVKSTGIFIYSVDIEYKGLTQVASITAANVRNARFCRDATKYYAVWENSVDGKIYYYNGTTTTELATGICPDIMYNSAVYLFWIDEYGIYQKTGNDTTKIIFVATSEIIKGLRVFLMPDEVFKIFYTIETESQSEIRMFESNAYTASIPTMTSNTAPSPYVASALREVNTNVAAWKAFDGNIGAYWYDSGSLPSWLNIKLKAPKSIKTYSITPPYNPSYLTVLYAPVDFILQGSNDGTNWDSIDIQTGLDYAGSSGWWWGSERQFTLLQASQEYLYFRLYITKNGTRNISSYGSGLLSVGTAHCMIGELQLYDIEHIYKAIHTADKGTLDRLQGSFTGNSIYLSWYQNEVVYGRAIYESEMFTEYHSTDSGDESYIPVMAANSVRGFVASADAAATGYEAYKAFDQSTATYWKKDQYGSALPAFLIIRLDKPAPIRKYSITPYVEGNFSGPINFKVQGSNNGNSWEDIDVQTNLSYVGLNSGWWYGERNFVLSQPSNPYRYYRLYVTSFGFRAVIGEGNLISSDNYCIIAEFKLYTKDESFKLYDGSSNLGRWTGATQFCSGFGDGLPVAHVADSEVDLVVWERDGNLVYAPKILNKPISADCTLSRSMESGSFNADFANNGEFVTGDLAELFQNEKKIGFEIGYDSEFIRKATGQADSDTVKCTESNIITISAKNKFYDLMQATITRNYDKEFTIGAKTTVLSGYALTGNIPADGAVEVRIDALNGKRWIPGSMEITNLTSGFTAITPVYGQTEFFGFVRIRNDSGTAGTPSFDVLAEDCTSLARKVGERGSILGESKTLTGTTAVRLEQKSIDGSKVASIAVKDANGYTFDYMDDPILTNYIIKVDSEGYTTIERVIDSGIMDGETIYIDYNYIIRTTFAMGFSDSRTNQDVLTFLQLSAPESYQVKVLSATGLTVDQYYTNYRPLHIFVESSINGAMLQFVLNHNYTGTVTYEVWARPPEDEQDFGIYPTPGDIFKDLARRALYKDVKFTEYNGTLEDGKFTSYDEYDLFFSIEEGFDPDTLRIENTSTKGDAGATSHDVNISIVEAGYIIDNDGYQNWGVRLSATRAAYSGASLDYSFQIWGQYLSRYDFLPPFNLSVSDLPQTNLTKPLRIMDITIEEAARKALQVCFADGRPFDMFIGSRGEWVIKLVKSEAFDDAAHTFKARNMGSITQKRKTPLVLDRVEIEGAATESYLIVDKPEKIDEISVHLPAKTHLEGYKVEFKKMYDPDSIYFFFTARWKCNVYIIERTASYCKIDFLNRTGNVDSYANATIEVWGTPISSVNYQQLYTAKTNPGAGGKYRTNTAEVQNELITDPITAGQVADQIIIESCQDALILTPETCPANPALEPMDTCIIIFEDFGGDVKALIEQLTFKFEMEDNKPTLTMDPELRPRKPWAAGFADENLSCDEDDGLDEDYEFDEDSNSLDRLNLIYG